MASLRRAVVASPVGTCSRGWLGTGPRYPCWSSRMPCRYWILLGELRRNDLLSPFSKKVVIFCSVLGLYIWNYRGNRGSDQNGLPIRRDLGSWAGLRPVLGARCFWIFFACRWWNAGPILTEFLTVSLTGLCWLCCPKLTALLENICQLSLS